MLTVSSTFRTKPSPGTIGVTTPKLTAVASGVSLTPR